MYFRFFSESFALNWYIFAALTNQKLLLPLWCRLNTNLFPDCVTLIGYLASAVNVVLFNPCVGPVVKVSDVLMLIY